MLKGNAAVWQGAVADITADVSDVRGLLSNLAQVKRPVAPTTHATVLLIPSQAFMKMVFEENPDISNANLVQHMAAAANIRKVFALLETVIYRIPVLMELIGHLMQPWDATSRFMCSRHFPRSGAIFNFSSVTVLTVSSVPHACTSCWLERCVIHRSRYRARTLVSRYSVSVVEGGPLSLGKALRWVVLERLGPAPV